jgi:hypothetical protein
MSKDVPITKPKSLAGSLTIIVIYAVVIIPFHEWLGQPGIVWAAIVVLAYGLIMREVVFSRHRRGIRALRKKDWQSGIALFEASLADLEKHPWKDRLRYVLILSPGSMDYREMAMVNLGFAYAQLGDKQSAASWYQRCLQDYPGNGIATAAMNLLNAQ